MLQIMSEIMSESPIKEILYGQINSVSEQKIQAEISRNNTAGLIREMVDRFLSWKLPKDFAPDAGVSFTPCGDHDSHHWPIGTNLLHAGQAEDMIRHMLGLPNVEGKGLAATNVTEGDKS